MTGIIQIEGAERLPVSMPGGDMTMANLPPRVVWHTTEATPGTATVWSNMIRVLNSKHAEPQVLYDPVTDRLGQFMPLNRSGRALRNDTDGYRNNRVGEVCIQIEVIAYASKPFTGYWKPGPNFKNLMAAVRSWGILDQWPAGGPPVFVANPPHNVPENDRDRPTWRTKGGHFSHSQVPGNDHGDPGGISVPKLFGAAPAAGDYLGSDGFMYNSKGQRSMSYNAIIYSLDHEVSGQYRAWREAMWATILRLGLAPAEQPHDQLNFRQAWYRAVEALGASANKYAFEYLVDRAGYWPPDTNDWPDNAWKGGVRV